MTENEAKEYMEDEVRCIAGQCDGYCAKCEFVKEEEPLLEAFGMAIKALEELQMYRQGKLCLIPAYVFKKQCEELDAFKEIGNLKELKALKENQRKCEDCAGCTTWKCDCSNIRNKAIDELKNKICMHFVDWKYSEDDKWIKDIIELASESVDEIAEQMKGSEQNEVD